MKAGEVKILVSGKTLKEIEQLLTQWRAFKDVGIERGLSGDVGVSATWLVLRR